MRMHLPKLILLLQVIHINCQFDAFGTGFNPDANLQLDAGRFSSVNPQAETADFFGQFTNGGVDGRGLCLGLGGSQVPDFDQINWNNIDRRCDEGWWHLYPFGERYYDTELNYGSSRLWQDRQIDLDFFLPYYGFRYNYTFIYPEGFVAFSYPRYVQPPYQFPAPGWPQKPDPSLLAAFLSPQSFMYVGDTKISHVWYRIIQRPIRLIQDRSAYMAAQSGPNRRTVPMYRNAFGQQAYQTLGTHNLFAHDGRVEDPVLLDEITLDIREGMVGTNGFVADYALIVTWERMGYGGAPKFTQLNQYNEIKTWQNTYQMVIASDEIRTYVTLNYANINWTSSTAAGAISGRGGFQSAVVGFNGGNGTGFFNMPYSEEGNSYKLVQYGSSPVAGRWVVVASEKIKYGGCTNESKGAMVMEQRYLTMQGGLAVNVSGPCFRPTDRIKMQIYELTVDCLRLSMVKARCMIPVNYMYHQGPTEVKLSVDGGTEYNFWAKAYIMAPDNNRMRVNLVDDPLIEADNWRNPHAANLLVKWNAYNLSSVPDAKVDIQLWGYWENFRIHDFTQIGSIATGIPNNGKYKFEPSAINKADMLEGAWQKYKIGFVMVRVSHDWKTDKSLGIYWSRLIPFGWYYKDIWEQQYGSDWALKMCQDWYEEDGKMLSFWPLVEESQSCPCTLDQAVIDQGRFMPQLECNNFGDGNCVYANGAAHCVISTFGLRNGASQNCCYNPEGWLMFTQDYESESVDYTRFYGAGTPFRAHPYGTTPYKRPPYIPSLSNYFRDILPKEMCCNWAGRCEFVYWRRESSGCQNYQPPVTAFAYGSGHFITFDGVKYHFAGSGFYVLTSLDTKYHSLLLEAMMEPPPKTIWDTETPSTVITGIAVKDSGSETVRVFARKEHRRWNYKLDVKAWGGTVYMDKDHKKLQIGPGVVIFCPPRSTDVSTVWLYFRSGTAVRVAEDHGVLSVQVVLPVQYNETYWAKNEIDETRMDIDEYGSEEHKELPSYEEKERPEIKHCTSTEHTEGLLGVFNKNPRDDLMRPDCGIITVNQPVRLEESIRLHSHFGEKWKIKDENFKNLFGASTKALYSPHLFDKPFTPEFDPWTANLGDASFIITKEQVQTACGNVLACEYDYLVTGRKEMAMDTLKIEREFLATKGNDGRKTNSCGPLQKNPAVIKIPPGNNYLDGSSVRFMCQPEYFLHGDERRSCVNGTWSPGWWAWCRDRKLEEGLKWFTGLMLTLLFITIIAGILGWCYCTNLYGRKHRAGHYTKSFRFLSPSLMAPPKSELKSLSTPSPDNNTVPRKKSYLEAVRTPKSKAKHESNGIAHAGRRLKDHSHYEGANVIGDKIDVRSDRHQNSQELANDRRTSKEIFYLNGDIRKPTPSVEHYV